MEPNTPGALDPDRPPERTYVLSVTTPASLRDRARAIALARYTSISHIIRTALEAYVQMEEGHGPHCAIGIPCICPRAWQFDDTPTKEEQS